LEDVIVEFLATLFGWEVDLEVIGVLDDVEIGATFVSFVEAYLEG
jgi:hypothetical protein